MELGPTRGRLVIGAGLVVIGAVFLIGQAVDIRVGDQLWPWFVIAPGIGLIVVGILAGGPPGVAFSIAGAITTMAGLVLFVQQLTGLYATWSYAWALVAPGGVGLGLLLAGWSQGDRDMVANGRRTALVGLGLFAGFGLFFEGVLGLSNGGQPLFSGPLLPAVLVVLGAILFLWGLVGRRAQADRA